MVIRNEQGRFYNANGRRVPKLVTIATSIHDDGIHLHFPGQKTLVLPLKDNSSKIVSVTYVFM